MDKDKIQMWFVWRLPKKRIVRGALRELKKYCKGSNLPDRWIKQDERGYYLKLNDRGNVHVR